jgi:hypothetical protein
MLAPRGRRHEDHHVPHFIDLGLETQPLGFIQDELAELVLFFRGPGDLVDGMKIAPDSTGFGGKMGRDFHIDPLVKL